MTRTKYSHYTDDELVQLFVTMKDAPYDPAYAEELVLRMEQRSALAATTDYKHYGVTQ